MPIEIRPVPVPERLGALDARVFEEYAELLRAEATRTWGHDHFAYSAPELLAFARDSRYMTRIVLGAWDGDELVGVAELTSESADAARLAEAIIVVAPDRRRRGIGTRLARAAERAAVDSGRPDVVLWSEHGDLGLRAVGDEVLHAPDGEAGLPSAEPAARFATGLGYELQQLDRVSRLDVEGRIGEFRESLARRGSDAATAGYQVVHWTDRAPDELVEAYAAARARMALDAPSGGLEFDEEHWDGERVRAREAERIGGGTGLLVAAAIAPDGTVAGYTELELPAGRPVVTQGDTLVVIRHRGHGLGMLLKISNLARLAEVAPERTTVYTWNADENDHMLAINLALGFELTGLAASWQRPDAATAGTAGTGATSGS